MKNYNEFICLEIDSLDVSLKKTMFCINNLMGELAANEEASIEIKGVYEKLMKVQKQFAETKNEIIIKMNNLK